MRHVISHLKVVLFAWKTIQNWLPTKDNLVKRGIIGADSRLCSAGSELFESVSPLFFKCLIFFKVWSEIAKWLGLEVVLPNNVSSPLFNFSRWNQVISM